MKWLIAFAALFLIGCIPLGAGIHYDADGFRAKIIFGAFRITVFPIPQWMKHRKKSVPKTDEPVKKTKQEKNQKGVGGSLSDFMPFVELGMDFLKTFRNKLRINRLNIKLILAADDPCDLAINYGRAWSAAGGLISVMERAFVIKKRDVEVGCDFTADSTCVYADVDLTISVSRILGIIIVYGIKTIKVYNTFKKKRKKAVQTQ